MSTTCCSSSEAPENLENTIASFVINVYEHVIYVVGIENSTLVYKPVPDGVNIFRLFEIEPPEEIDNLPIVNLKIDFNDGGLPDVAQLIRNRNDLPQDQEDSNNECILSGYLRDEDDVPVDLGLLFNPYAKY